jgi:CheY-like chemotaxis protein
MSQQPHNIAVLGFSTFEVGAFEAFFKMVGVSRPPGFLVTRDTTAADLIFLNATGGLDVQRFMRTEANGRPVIVIGEADASLGVATLPRPIRLTSALSLANQLIAKAQVEKLRQASQQSKPLEAAAIARPVKPVDTAPSTISPAFWSLTPGQKFASTQAAVPQAVDAAQAMQEALRRAEAPVARALPPAVSTPLPPPVSISIGAVPKEQEIPAAQKRAMGPNAEAAQVLNRFAVAQRANVTSSPAVVSPPIARAAMNESAGLPPELAYDDILVVDDSDIALKFMQEHLGSFGFRVHLAKSGEECLMMLNQSKFRCVFLDVMMTGIDGYQTCRVIKQRKYPDGSAPTVVMMTSRSGAIDRVRGALAGCDGYLVKPVDETKLIKALFQHKVSSSPTTATNMRKRFDTLAR